MCRKFRARPKRGSHRPGADDGDGDLRDGPEHAGVKRPYSSTEVPYVARRLANSLLCSGREMCLPGGGGGWLSAVGRVVGGLFFCRGY